MRKGISYFEYLSTIGPNLSELRDMPQGELLGIDQNSRNGFLILSPSQDRRPIPNPPRSRSHQRPLLPTNSTENTYDSQRLQEISLHDTLLPSLPIQRPGLVTRELSATAPPLDLQAFFYARNFVLWRLCVGRLRACRIP